MVLYGEDHRVPEGGREGGSGRERGGEGREGEREGGSGREREEEGRGRERERDGVRVRQGRERGKREGEGEGGKDGASEDRGRQGRERERMRGQWITRCTGWSAELVTYGEAVKACSLRATITSLKRILEVRVWPW